MKRFVIVYAIVANLVLLDGVTKELAEHSLRNDRSVSVIDGFFNFSLVHNRGCAWGFLQGHTWPLAVFGLVALAFLIWKRRAFFPLSKIEEPRWLARLGRLPSISEPLLYAGIIGNVVDRLFRGYVIDMLDFHWHNAWHYPCFNLADAYICVSVALLLLCSFAKRTS